MRGNYLDIYTWQGPNGVYTLTLDQYTNEFEVSPGTGQGSTPAIILIRNTSLIDYERGPRQYVMKVTDYACFSGREECKI